MVRSDKATGRSNANNPEYYLELLESKKNDPETVKEAVRGFRTSLPEPLEINELAAKLKIDPRTARRWEEEGSPMRTGILVKFRTLLPAALDEAAQIKRAIEKRTLGLITFGEMLEDHKGKLQRVIVCTCNPLKEQVKGSMLRNAVLNSMADGVKYVYVYPEKCEEVERSLKIFKDGLRDSQQKLVEAHAVPWHAGLFSVGVIYIICETKPEPEKPDGETFGFIYCDMEFTTTAVEKGIGYLCLPMGNDLYVTFMRQLQEYEIV